MNQRRKVVYSESKELAEVCSKRKPVMEGKERELNGGMK